MRKFNVVVNGASYDVEVEEVGAGAPQSFAPPTPQTAAPAAPAAPAAVPAATPEAAALSGEKIVAPMPGTIMKVNVSVGDHVKYGAVLLILEAMKMENEIVATKEGTVAQVLAITGASVNSGEPLVVIQ
ncbi:MAG: biotin/lipoyl-binding protein [Eubacteriales bacterium]|jgi:biotin carboxyl carrier protein|nr:biotin/lipoyl-binding protein [Eubacteriales bacterium]